MHTHRVITTGLLLGSLAVIVPACVGAVESSDTGAGGANMTPGEEDTAEAVQGLGYCGCSTLSDYCWLTVGGTCVFNFNNCTKTAVRGCGIGLLSPCNGECVRR